MNNPALQRRVDQILATAPQRVFLSGIAVATVLTTSLALGLSSDAADGWLVVLVSLFALGSVLQPDDHLGLVTIMLVVVHWLVAGLPVVSAWSLGVAASIVIFHSLLAIMAVTPHTADLPMALLVVWLRRLVVVGASTLGVWLLVVGFERRNIDGDLGLSVAAYAALIVAIVALRLAYRSP